MPLTKCPDCARDVSTLAAACPHCGRPTEAPAPSDSRNDFTGGASEFREWMASGPAHVVFLIAIFCLGASGALISEGLPNRPEGYAYIVGAGVGRLGISLVPALLLFGWWRPLRRYIPAITFGVAILVGLLRLF